MKTSELKVVMDAIVAHFTGWLVLAPLAGFGFGGLLAIANWIGGFGFGIAKCYVAGWAVACAFFSLEVLLTATRQVEIKHTHVMPSPTMGSFPQGPGMPDLH